MPLISEFSGYSGRVEGAARWTKTLYNHPVSSAIDYFIVNLKESADVMDKESGGHLKHKLRIKVGK